MKILKKFIREEFVATSSWLRRPKQGLSRVPSSVSVSPALMSTPISTIDVSDDIEQQRQSLYSSIAGDFTSSVDSLRHTLETLSDVDMLLNAMEAFGEDPRELVQDPTELDQAVRKDDVENVRRMLLNALDKWSSDKLRSSEQDDYDGDTLLGHPMRSVKGGGFSFKRPIRP